MQEGSMLSQRLASKLYTRWRRCQADLIGVSDITAVGKELCLIKDRERDGRIIGCDYIPVFKCNSEKTSDWKKFSGKEPKSEVSDSTLFTTLHAMRVDYNTHFNLYGTTPSELIPNLRYSCRIYPYDKDLHIMICGYYKSRYFHSAGWVHAEFFCRGLKPSEVHDRLIHERGTDTRICVDLGTKGPKQILYMTLLDCSGYVAVGERIIEVFGPDGPSKFCDEASVLYSTGVKEVKKPFEPSRVFIKVPDKMGVVTYLEYCKKYCTNNTALAAFIANYRTAIMDGTGDLTNRKEKPIYQDFQEVEKLDVWDKEFKKLVESGRFNPYPESA